ncbi:MAG: serine/threonine protein kinase [Nanoarchaeota archaeon]
MQIGNYEVQSLIGEGGFARAYKVRHVQLDEPACLKQSINVSAQDTELLRREAKLLWGLNHHSLPSVKDFFEVGDGSSAYVMNYVSGRSVEELVADQGPIHPEDMCWVAQRTLQALHYLHANGVVHSDVKPQNIIVQPQTHNAVLLDYGLSAFRPKGDSRPIGYTQVFAAPELQRGMPPLPESDFYGMGMTMLYGIGGDPVSQSYPKTVPDRIRDFCDSLLVYDPLKRPRWEQVDLVGELSDIRQEVFGRRHLR